MKVLMKRFLVSDEELNNLFATEATSGVTKPMMAQSTSSGTDKSGSFFTTTEAALTVKAKTLELQEYALILFKEI